MKCIEQMMYLSAQTLTYSRLSDAVILTYVCYTQCWNAQAIIWQGLFWYYLFIFKVYCTILINLSPLHDCDTPDENLCLSLCLEACDMGKIPDSYLLLFPFVSSLSFSSHSLFISLFLPPFSIYYYFILFIYHFIFATPCPLLLLSIA